MEPKEHHADSIVGTARVPASRRAQQLAPFIVGFLFLFFLARPLDLPSGKPLDLEGDYPAPAAGPTDPHAPPPPHTHTDWDSIQPGEKLSWVRCFDGLYCARLTVPLDYARPLNESAAHPRVHLALAMVPSARSAATGAFGAAPLLVNPGGPGGAGAQMVVATGAGRALQAAAGGTHDLVGFDPRGIGASTPPADCFLEPEPGPRGHRNAALLRRLAWAQDGHGVGLVNSSGAALRDTVRRARLLSGLCGTRGGGDSVLRYMGTPTAARDMLSIVHAWDEWVDESGGEGLASKSDGVVGGEDSAGPSSTAVADNKGKLVYWGFSYGTALGATFASMFPEAVGRMVLDGVMDSGFYFEPLGAPVLRDTDSVLASFFESCHESAEGCRLYRDGDNVADIEARFHQVVEGLREEPVAFIHATLHTPLIVTHSDIKKVIFMFLYSPVAAFPTMALLLDMIFRGEDLSPLAAPVDMPMVCAADFKPLIYPDDGNLVVSCSDARYKKNETLASRREDFEKLTKTTRFADLWTTLSMFYTGWQIETVDPPEMDWAKFASKANPVNTSFPILFVSNTRDPVTPLRNGLIMTQKFPNSGFLEQESVGHCSLAAFSVCTMTAIQAYLNDGKVPPRPIFDDKIIEWPSQGRLEGDWAKCEVDQKPFQAWTPVTVGGVRWSQGAQTEAQHAMSLWDTGPESDAITVERWKDAQASFLRHVSPIRPPRMFEDLLYKSDDVLARLETRSRRI